VVYTHGLLGSLIHEAGNQSPGRGDGVATARRPAARSSAQFPHARISASLSRRFVAVTLHRWGLDARAEVVVLLAGELVTNAIAHTHSTTIGLVVSLLDQAVRVEVHDASPQRPKLDHLGAGDGEGGRGLRLVAELATRWGVDSTAHGEGKSVWFEVPPA
jgi:anti-sigma regulatory factor (Ser/Thr protein kinase)